MPTGDYDAESIESKWQDHWVEAGTYAYDGDPDADPDTRYSIDTPPPTVSGGLHIGHLYGHTLQDFAARYHRMARSETFFPFGYDDNGIASERLTEQDLGIRHQEFTRREFQERCREVCREYENSFTRQMQSLAASVDWSRTYKTIEPRVQRISQLSFIDLYEKGREYRKRAPAIWCPDCETAISQVETESDHRHTTFNDIAFEVTGERDDFVVSTTRPELLPACVAVFVHPDDDRNADLVGETATVPLFDQEVPVLADERVDMETGSGIVMCCTFGDRTDIEWYQAHDLPLRLAIDESGTMTDLAGDLAG
ncbi:valine--tRNA ligase, partial [Halobacteriales archaeon SW_7_68_16]